MLLGTSILVKVFYVLLERILLTRFNGAWNAQHVSVNMVVDGSRLEHKYIIAHVVLDRARSVEINHTSISHVRVFNVSLKSLRFFYCKKITRISTLKYTFDDDENSTRASRSNTGTTIPRIQKTTKTITL